MLAFASSTRTDSPDRARVMAAARPFGPEPTTTASYETGIVITSNGQNEFEQTADLVSNYSSVKRWLLCFLLGLALQPVLGSENDADATAKFLAGLPVRGTSLENRSLERPWATHANELDRLWNRFEQEQLTKIQTWSPHVLGD